MTLKGNLEIGIVFSDTEGDQVAPTRLAGDNLVNSMGMESVKLKRKPTHAAERQLQAHGERTRSTIRVSCCVPVDIFGPVGFTP